MASQNAVSWFEIPVVDMERAMTFYEAVFAVKLERHKLGPVDMAWFPFAAEAAGAGGALVCNKEWYKPAKDTKEGVLVYFTAHSGDLNVELGRVVAAGGRVVVPRTQISEEYGFMAVFLDSEGNRVALHSRT